jgi:hypothetical protein
MDAQNADNAGMDAEQLKAQLIADLEIYAVQMDKREFSKEEYNKLFPRGTVETPIGQVIIGKNQFEKLESKDNGKRKISSAL